MKARTKRLCMPLRALYDKGAKGRSSSLGLHMHHEGAFSQVHQALSVIEGNVYGGAGIQHNLAAIGQAMLEALRRSRAQVGGQRGQRCLAMHHPARCGAGYQGCKAATE
jgi:hypothetical protein